MCSPPYATYVRRGRPGGDRPATRAELALFADGDFRLTNWTPDVSAAAAATAAAAASGSDDPFSAADAAIAVGPWQILLATS